MTAVVLYHLTRMGLDAMVVRLLNRALGQGWRGMALNRLTQDKFEGRA